MRLTNCHNSGKIIELVADGNQEQEGHCFRAMWRSVITQALMDAASNSNKKSEKSNKIKALRWLQGDNEDFLMVCHLADMDPNHVRVQAKAALARGCKWRNDNRSSIAICIEQENFHYQQNLKKKICA